MTTFKPTHTDIPPEVLRALMTLTMLVCQALPAPLGSRSIALFKGMDATQLPNDDVIGAEYYLTALEWLADQGRAAGLLPNKEQSA